MFIFPILPSKFSVFIYFYHNLKIIKNPLFSTFFNVFSLIFISLFCFMFVFLYKLTKIYFYVFNKL